MATEENRPEQGEEVDLTIRVQHVQLGDLVEDEISHYRGIAVARTEHLYGCVRVIVSPQDKAPDGKLLPNYEFDEAQLVVLEQWRVSPDIDVIQKAPAGPRSHVETVPTEQR